MLQQTRVETVKPYYERFLAALPDIESLAAADEELLLKLWEGLGYYSRVRNMQKCARLLCMQYDGQLPDSYEKLCTLPGIGPYTAGAIASIAFGKPYPAVDGNVLRIWARLNMDDRDMKDAAVQKEIRNELCHIISQERPGDFNQALMDLGACVCIPGEEPRCEQCPFAKICLAHMQGQTAAYPKRADKRPRPVEEKTMLVISDGEKIALHKRPEKGLLAGMYELPSLAGFCNQKEALDYVCTLGLSSLHIEALPPAKHIFTHREWHMQGYLVRIGAWQPDGFQEDAGGVFFADLREIQKRYPIPSAFSPFLKQILTVESDLL